ncbi:MAG: lipocalin-like domain-containing protein, partial [Cyanobacteria bacterium J06642_11]
MRVRSRATSSAQPYRVWLEDWSATKTDSGLVQLVADADDVALDLTLT